MSDVVFSRDLALLSLSTPLGLDVLVPIHATLDEAVSEPFVCIIDAVSSRAAIDPDTLLYKPVCLRLNPPDRDVRYIHGLVRRVVCLGTQERDVHLYRLELVPRLWFLSQSEDCRIFEDRTTTDILKTLLQEGGVTDVSLRMSGDNSTRPLTVQFNESRLAFLTRLIEESGWFYLFRHTQTAHTLVVADSASAFTATQGGPHRITTLGAVCGADVLAAWQAGRSTAWGEVCLADDNPDDRLTEASTRTNFKAAGASSRTMFHWPAGVHSANQVSPRTRLRMEAAEAAACLADGQGSDAGFIPGGRFSIAAGEAGTAEFVLLRVVHEATDTTWTNAADAPAYRNRFVAQPATLRLQPLSTQPKPRLEGMYSAEVIGPHGEDVHTDAMGRIKLRFRWDHRADANPGGGMWVRVMHPWAGLGSGFVAIPRVGSEVAVSFMDADPDRPVVVGQLYGKDALPLSLPEQKTRTGLRTCSTPSGGEQGASEFWFDDKRGEELVFLHAERDLTVEVEHSVLTTIDEARTTTIKRGDDQLTVSQGNRAVDVPNGNHAITSKTGDIKLRTQGGAITLEAMTSLTLKVGQSSITLDPSGITIKATQVEIEGQALASLKGAITKIDADGLLKAVGGIMMLN